MAIYEILIDVNLMTLTPDLLKFHLRDLGSEERGSWIHD
jgi:hypothetical protein